MPLGDFFCNGWAEPCNVTSLPIAVNPRGGFNSYWPMPFRQSARITIENLWEEDSSSFYYQVDYALTDVAGGCRLPARPVAAQQPAADR